MENWTKERLIERVKALESENKSLRALQSSPLNIVSDTKDLPHESARDDLLTLDEYKRYGRQIIVPTFGSIGGQMSLKRSRILVVGAGGLGCPALLYLAAAGVGHIGIIDNDRVDTSNLHRQILHSQETLGMLKCESAKRNLQKLNPFVEIKLYPFLLSNDNAFEIFEKYDVILDCTDTPATRYLINDVCVLIGRPLVSGAGLKSDGQLTILNLKENWPCYRCLYPKPPDPGSITSCSEGGVIGPAIGLVGISMALETIKIVTGFYNNADSKPFMLVYSGYPLQQYRLFKIRNRQPNCSVCGSNPDITKEDIRDNIIDYGLFCGKLNPNVLDSKLRVSVQDYNKYMKERKEHLLLDVRPKEQFDIVHLPHSINIQWDSELRKENNIDSKLPVNFDKDKTPVFVICRYGNDSQLAAKKLIEEMHFKSVKDIQGGISKWSEIVDPSMPQY